MDDIEHIFSVRALDWLRRRDMNKASRVDAWSESEMNGAGSDRILICLRTTDSICHGIDTLCTLAKSIQVREENSNMKFQNRLLRYQDCPLRGARYCRRYQIL